MGINNSIKLNIFVPVACNILPYFQIGFVSCLLTDLGKLECYQNSDCVGSSCKLMLSDIPQCIAA